MRKKSHISLAKFIVENMEAEALQQHRKAFYLGCVLPDCRPSFLTCRHEFDATFDMVSDGIRALTENCGEQDWEKIAYWRRLGEVTHYVADYFTFPHNGSYEGTLREHCAYEKSLMDYLKEYIASGSAALTQIGEAVFESVDALLDFIRSSHAEYLKKRTHSVEEDVRYIVHLCRQVVAGIVQLVNDGALTA